MAHPGAYFLSILLVTVLLAILLGILSWRAAHSANQVDSLLTQTLPSSISTKTKPKIVTNLINNFTALLQVPASAQSTLGAIVLVCHSSEITNGKLKHFFRNIRIISKQSLMPEFWFASSKGFTDSEKVELNRLMITYNVRKQISAVHYFEGKVNKTDDSYIRYNETVRHKGAFGYATGPNIMFYQMMDFFGTRFHSILLLEWDCFFPRNYWYDNLYNLANIESFWVIGGIYRGAAKLPSSFIFHLNGVAIYNVGDPSFQKFVEVLKAFHLLEIEERPWLAFDIAPTLLLHELLSVCPGFEACAYNELLRLIRSMLIHTNLIVNLSTDLDLNYTNSDLQLKFPKAAIYHQKRLKSKHTMEISNKTKI